MCIRDRLLCANLQPRCEVLGEIPEQLDFFDAMYLAMVSSICFSRLRMF